MQEYQCGIRSEDLIPFGASPMDFGSMGFGYGITESDHYKGAGLAILIIMLTIPVLCVLAFFWMKERVSNFMTRLRHRRSHNEEVNQVPKEQVPDHIRGY